MTYVGKVAAVLTQPEKTLNWLQTVTGLLYPLLQEVNSSRGHAWQLTALYS
jgi:hypothetical protein